LSSLSPITVVLARFDDLLAAGLGELIERDPALELVARDVEQGRLDAVMRGHRPGVAILNLQAMAQLSEIRDIAARFPATRLVLLANEPSAAECLQTLSFGASALLGRDTQARDVLNAIHLASRGLQVLPRSTPEGPVRSAMNLLTPRESEVLPLLREGCSNAQIALALGVGVETVRTHARSIYRKLGVSSRRELSAPPISPQRADSAPPASTPRWRRPASSARVPRRGGGLSHR
jgi:DNA-binding NarL/FixJ family response regulator